MFLHLGGDVVVSKEDIIAILDVRTRQAPVTKEFIEIARDEGFIKSIYDQEKEKSFVITTRDIYMSPISCITLKKRAEIFLDF
ncbi:MAG: extracellular matrix/biofilm biosynthesis regulator RemA family protein [Desulfotomaculaceae bacterium]